MNATTTIDLNTADIGELQDIPGIGRRRAQDIVEHRPFQDWMDLKRRVPGFGDALVSALRENGVVIESE